MDYNYGNGDYNQNPQMQPPVNTDKNTNGLSTAALVLGILAIVTCCCVFGSFIFGGIAIILALLSKGYETKLNSNAKIGIVLSSIGIVLGIIMSVIYIAYFAAIYNTDSFQSILDEYEYYYDNPSSFDDYNDYKDNYNIDDFNNFYDDNQDNYNAPDSL